MSNVWTRIRETVEQQGSAALLSVVGTAGSAPRETGARIVLRPDGGFFGSIGGGRLEYEAIDAARAALAAGRGKANFRDWPLGPNLGQCCGGLVTTLIETFDATDLATVRRLEDAERAGEFMTTSEVDEHGRIVRSTAQAIPERKAVRGTPFAEQKPFVEKFGEARQPLLLFGAGHVGRALVLALAPLPFSVRWIDSRADQFPQHVPANVTCIVNDQPEGEIAAAPEGVFALVM